MSSDLSIVDLDVPFGLIFVVASTVNTGFSLVVLAVVTWQVLFVSVPMIYLALRLQVSSFFLLKLLLRMRMDIFIRNQKTSQTELKTRSGFGH